MSDNSSLQGSLMNHYGLYLVTLMSQCNDEQMMEWLPRAYTMSIIGCYAQTELGHGSNVRGLQTVAVFDRQLKAFVLHTPTPQIHQVVARLSWQSSDARARLRSADH